VSRIAPLLVGVAIAAAASPTALGQTPDERVAACIANNSARYGEPSSATVAQYFSLAGACRAAVQGRPGIDVVLTPDGVRAGPASGGPAGAPPTAPTSGPPPGSLNPGAADTPSSGGKRRPTAIGEPVPFGAAPPRDGATLARTALAVRDPSGSSLTSPVGALTPIGAGSLAACALVGVGGFFRRRRNSG
jgi:hypothetical protein